jgi:chromosome segregation ATPase
MQGVIRFLFFVAIVALVLTGIYANSLRMTVAEVEGARASVVSERDSLKMKLDTATKEAETAKSELASAQTKITDLEGQLQAASKPRGRSR